MTTTVLSLSVTIEDGDPATFDLGQATLGGVADDLSALAARYVGRCAGVSFNAYNATDPDPDPTEDDLGRVAYDAHTSTLLAAEIVDSESVDDFDDLHPDLRYAWIQAALAARNA